MSKEKGETVLVKTATKQEIESSVLEAKVRGANMRACLSP